MTSSILMLPQEGIPRTRSRTNPFNCQIYVTMGKMPFPESVVEDAWKRSGGKCECPRTSHGHNDPHNRTLIKSSRGREGIGAWEAHHKNKNGGDTLSNCEILCWDCHKKTL